MHDELGPSAAGGDALRPDDGTLPERRYGTRARWLSWLFGLIGIAILVLIAIWLSHHASQSGPGGAGGPGGGRGRHAGGRGGGRGGFGGAAMPTTVGTVKVATANLPVVLEALGTVTPAATVTVRPQVSGTIVRLLYREGQIVRKGQALVEIDPRTYRASLTQAQGALARDQAQLANARLTLNRYQTLLQQDSIARQDVDTQAALVRQLEGTVEVDRGQVQGAEINLGYTKVVAPVSGRIGLKTVDIGNVVTANDATGVATITTLQPIDVEFAVPQQQAPAIERRVAQGATLPAVALDATRTVALDHGRFSTLDNQVDVTTGTIKAKARFPNANYQLYPNQFVNIRLTVDTVHDALVVPPSAVRNGPDGSFVWLLQPDRTVTERQVTTGVSTADQVQITSGLAIGDVVVTDGGDRLAEGAKVRLPTDKLPPMGTGGWQGRGQAGGWRHHRGGASAGNAAGSAGASGAASPAAGAAGQGWQGHRGGHHGQGGQDAAAPAAAGGPAPSAGAGRGG